VKHIIFAKALGSRTELQQWLLRWFGSGPLTGASAVAVNLVADSSAPWDAVTELWRHDEAELQAGFEAELARRCSQLAEYAVTELVGKDLGPDRGWPTLGIKTVVPWIGRSDVSVDERRRHWDEHMPLANRVHVGVTRYVRNWVEAPASRAVSAAPDYQGIATQHFLTQQDLETRMFDSPASVQVIADDVADFVAEHVFLVTTEYFRRADS
jgi:hypothetical protein